MDVSMLAIWMRVFAKVLLAVWPFFLKTVCSLMVRNMLRWRSGVMFFMKNAFFYLKKFPQCSNAQLYTHEKQQTSRCVSLKLKRKTLHSLQWMRDLVWGFGLVLVLFWLGVCCVFGVGCNGKRTLLFTFLVFVFVARGTRAAGPRAPGPGPRRPRAPGPARAYI